LQILNKSIGEAVARSLAPRRLSPACAAVRTGKLHFVFLRIAVKSRPSGPANADWLYMLPRQWRTLLLTLPR